MIAWIKVNIQHYISYRTWGGGGGEGVGVAQLVARRYARHLGGDMMGVGVAELVARQYTSLYTCIMQGM